MEPRSITDMEVRHAVLNTKLKRCSYFYLRSTDAPATASGYVDPPPLLSKLEQLKKDDGAPVAGRCGIILVTLFDTNVLLDTPLRNVAL